MTENAAADSSVYQPIPPGRLDPGCVVQLKPSEKIVTDLTRVPKELRATLAVVGDSRWDLNPLAQKKTVTSLPINFDSFPSAYRDTAKRLIWAYINVATPLAELDRPTATRTRLTPSSVSANAGLLRNWMHWLTERNVQRFSDVSEQDFQDYGDHHTASGVDRAVVANRLFAITRAWLYGPYMPSADTLTRPTWERGPEGREDVLGAANWSSENKIIPIHPQTMSALLVWATRYIENFSPDIIAAKVMKSVPREIDPELAPLTHNQRFHLYLNRRRESTHAAPGMFPRSRPDQRCFANTFIGWELGIPGDEVPKYSLPTSGLEPTDEAQLPLAITGTVDGQRKWTDAINFYEVDELCRHLATAALITVAYLTGIRGEECRALERGCCKPVANGSEEPTHYVIQGKTFKGALDNSGNTIPTGLDREHPWLAIAPVAKAIAVMEALHPDSDLLFPAEAFTAAPALSLQGAAVRPLMARQRIADFIDWCNETALRLGRTEDVIPPDPEGRVVVRRFRRTLAWFIYRKPGGRIALGVQYGHLRGYTTDGYGSRVASGLRDVFPMEEALARAEYLEDACTRLEDGEDVTGPAAGRYTEALRLYGQEFRGRYMSGKQAAALRANPRLRIY